MIVGPSYFFYFFFFSLSSKRAISHGHLRGIGGDAFFTVQQKVENIHCKYRPNNQLMKLTVTHTKTQTTVACSPMARLKAIAMTPSSNLSPSLFRNDMSFECDDVTRRAHISRNREQQATAPGGGADGLLRPPLQKGGLEGGTKQPISVLGTDSR